MSTTFRTAVVRTPGGPDSIEIIDVPVVEPGPGQVRVAEGEPGTIKDRAILRHNLFGEEKALLEVIEGEEPGPSMTGGVRLGTATLWR